MTSHVITDLEKLAAAEKRIRSLINNEKRAFSEFVQAATEFHKPGLTQTKQEIDAVGVEISDMKEASIQKTLSKIPEASAPQVEAPSQAQAMPPQAPIGTDNIFGFVNSHGKVVFGISTYYSQIFQLPINYHIEISSSHISAIKDDGVRSDIKYTKSLQSYIINNLSESDNKTLMQNYKTLVDFAIPNEIEMLKNAEVLDALYKTGVVLSKFKKYQVLRKWYDLPDQEEAVKYKQQMQTTVDRLQIMEPQAVADYKAKYPDGWKRLEQFSPEQMKQITNRVYTPQQRRPTVEDTSPEADVPTSEESSEESFQEAEETQRFPGKHHSAQQHTGKGLIPYKRLTVLLGAAKTGVKDENRAEFTNILDKLMSKRLIDRRARELLLSRFNKI